MHLNLRSLEYVFWDVMVWPMSTAIDQLPLTVKTPPQWVATAVVDSLELLNDHAHLEKKAANNALELVSRWPGKEGQNEWAAGMSAIAQDETQHLGQVGSVQTGIVVDMQ